MTYQTGKTTATSVGDTVSGGSTSLDTRQLYAFKDEIASLDAVRSPFFAYLSKVRKVPVDSQEFKMLEDRTKIDYTSRQFYLSGAHSFSGSTVGDTFSFTVTDAATAANSIDWLIKGMDFSIGLTDDGPEPVIVRIETIPVDAGTTTTFTGRIVGDPTGNLTTHTSNDDTLCQIIGTAYAPGTGSPDVWSRDLDSTFGYTQIFKTAAEWDNSALATVYRGYKSERERVWALKLVEQAVDIERALLHGVRASQSGILYTWGVIGGILANQNLQTGTTAWTYKSGKSYVRQVNYSSMTYDVFLGDLEVFFDPARGGAQKKLVMAGLPPLSFLNKMGNSSFIDNSVGYSNSPFRLDINFDTKTGVFGHKILTIETIHGTLNIVKNPLLNGPYKDFMVAIDLANVAYRPLIGNGVNRDTHILLNVQARDEDLRKDMILTEAGLQFGLPESHGLWSFA